MKKLKPEGLPAYVEPGMVLLGAAQIGFADGKKAMIGNQAGPVGKPSSGQVETVKLYLGGLRKKVQYINRWIKAAEREG